MQIYRIRAIDKCILLWYILAIPGKEIDYNDEACPPHSKSILLLLHHLERILYLLYHVVFYMFLQEKKLETIWELFL